MIWSHVKSRTLQETVAIVRVLNPCSLPLAHPNAGIALLKQIARRVANSAVFLQSVALYINFSHLRNRDFITNDRVNNIILKLNLSVIDL